MNTTEANVTFILYRNASESHCQAPAPDTTYVTTPLVIQGAACYALVICNICGNSLVLVVTRTTPSLWTKTNKILASLAVSDLAIGLSCLYYIPYNLITSVVNDPCTFNVANAATRWLFLIFPYSTCYNTVVVAIDRYVAIIHPLHYETKMTDAVVYRMIAVAWFMGIFTGALSLFWLVNADVMKCPILPVKFSIVDALLYAVASAIVVSVYGRILLVAWQQHVAVASMSVVPTSVTFQSNKDSSVPETPAEQSQKQSQKKMKREFKALRLTLAIVGAFIILWLPHEVGVTLEFADITGPYVTWLTYVGSSTGMINSCFDWVLYAGVSKTYQKAIKRVLRNALLPVAKFCTGKSSAT